MIPQPIYMTFPKVDTVVTTRLLPIYMTHLALIGLYISEDHTHYVAQVYGYTLKTTRKALGARWIVRRGHATPPRFLPGPQGRLP